MTDALLILDYNAVMSAACAAHCAMMYICVRYDERWGCLLLAGGTYYVLPGIIIIYIHLERAIIIIHQSMMINK